MIRGMEKLTRFLCILATLGMTTVATSQFAEAGGHCSCPACVGGGGPVYSGPAYQTVERVVYRNVMVPETRTIHTTEYRPQVEERTVTVHRRVPETKQVTETVMVTVPVQKTRTVNYHQTRQVWEEVDQNYTVYVPHVETKTGVRTVCRPVQVETVQTVCRDHGYFEDVTCAVPCRHCCRRRCCGGCGCPVCGGCGVVHVTQRVWRPNYVTEQVPTTVWQNNYVQEEYQYNVTVSHPEVQTRKVRVCRYVTEQQSKEVPYTAYEQQPREQTRNVTTYKVVAEQRKEQCTVMVPHQVEKQVTVMVCRTVAETISCQVPVYCGSCF